MDIRNGLDGLKTLLGVTTPAASASLRIPEGLEPAEGTKLTSDTATVSNAASEVAQSATETGVRAEKVAGVQVALAAGTYRVPSSAVASKVVDAMLGRGK
jgi:anti-sigma28 factor (negative regulator of flagellin synthesis)